MPTIDNLQDSEAGAGRSSRSSSRDGYAPYATYQLQQVNNNTFEQKYTYENDNNRVDSLNYGSPLASTQVGYRDQDFLSFDTVNISNGQIQPQSLFQSTVTTAAGLPAGVPEMGDADAYYPKIYTRTSTSGDEGGYGSLPSLGLSVPGVDEGASVFGLSLTNDQSLLLASDDPYTSQGFSQRESFCLRPLVLVTHTDS